MRMISGRRIFSRKKIQVTVLLILSLSAHGQDYNIKTYTTDNGLSHNNVRDMIYDSTGFLWITTWDGLNRYDGYEFRKYHHIPGDSTSLPFFSVNKLVIDGNDGLWVAGDNSTIARLDRVTNTFKIIKYINGEPVPPLGFLNSDPEGNVWLSSSRVFYRYNYKTGEFKKYDVLTNDKMNGFFIGYTFSVFVEKRDRIWLAGDPTYECELDDFENKIILRRVFRSVKRQVPAEKIIRNYDHYIWYKLETDRKGNKWVFSNMGLYRLDLKKSLMTEYSEKEDTLDFNTGKPLGWGDVFGGFYILREGTGPAFKIPDGTSQLLKSYCSCGKDMIWFSNTSFSGNSLGLNRIIFTPGYFKKYDVSTETDKLPAVYSIAVDNKEQVWIGIRGRDHLVVFTPGGRIIKKYTQASALPNYYGPARSLKRVAGGMWVGYFWGMLLFYDYSTETFREYKPGQYLFRSLQPRDDGKLYMGNAELILYDPLTDTKEILHDSISDGGIFRLSIEKNGTLWSGLPKGRILRYEPAGNKVTIFQQKNTSNNTEDIWPGDSSNIWLAMLGGGIVKFNTQSLDSKVYTTSEGLSNNTVYSLLGDRLGNIWASTDNGISRLNPSTGIIRNFGIREGLDIVEFNSGASFIDDDGNFYFGGMGGAIKFNPDSITKYETRTSDSKLFLSGLTVSGKTKRLKEPFYKADTIILEKGENNFHCTFGVTDFSNSDKTLFRYRLEGIDKDWINTDHLNRNINYAGLKPGALRLRLQATDRLGEWTISKDLIIIIKPYFYQRKIFFILTGLFVFGLFHLIISLYLRNYRNKARLAQDELRLQSLRGQMNPHFIFNSLNSINYFISNNDKLSANRYISDFSRLIRTILSNMGSDYVPFSEEMNSVRDYLAIEHLRFGDKFDYVIDLRGAEEKESLLVFPGLIQPFIENAIWHGMRALTDRKGIIRIKVILNGKNKTTCIIEDDGIGRQASMEMKKNGDGHKSRGIEIVMERLQIVSKMRGINYSLEITDVFPGKKQTGTRVKIDIPSKMTPEKY